MPHPAIAPWSPVAPAGGPAFLPALLPPPPPSRLSVADRPFDLQMFAGEKTEPATEKRREEARQRGNLAKSQDLDSVVVMLAGFLILQSFGPTLVGMIGEYFHYVLSSTLTTELTAGNVFILVSQMLLVTAKCLAPVFVVIILAAVTANVLQVGFLLTFDPLFPDLERLNPVAGLENLLSWKSIGELVKSIFKIMVVAYVPYATLRDQMPTFLRLIQLEPLPGMIALARILFAMAIKIILILLVLAFADYWFQWWRYEENMKMSKEEIKEEYKQREGDPKVKAKIRERQRRIATRRMMAEVPKATVVVTNPTHIAVALQYQQGDSSAPRVVAMGTELMAQKIKEIARQHGVPVIENKPLAQALFKMVDVGDEIPADLYAAVAEILAQVFRMRSAAA
ncbi:MAG: flagellar biosynthesis protein FlhB [Candidatus Riflebacteria bacterium]|nr:flagellar biosynthesis protein FlhB [Candidatus Riflebacteria bacterium]